VNENATRNEVVEIIERFEVGWKIHAYDNEALGMSECHRVMSQDLKPSLEEEAHRQSDAVRAMRKMCVEVRLRRGMRSAV
jgi:hypothetical protein